MMTINSIQHALHPNSNPIDTTQPPKRSTDLWFDDGNIVLCVGNTLFRVHRSVLCANSPIFKDMFSLPSSQPQNGEETIEGCSVVNLLDNEDDWTCILMAFYSAGRNIDAPPDFYSDHVFSPGYQVAYLRLGEKYSISHLQQKGTLALLASFPCTLSALDEIYNKGHSVAYIMFAIKLSRIAPCGGGRGWLPAAYYMMCKNFCPEDFMGGGTDRYEPLAYEDQKAVVTGWHKLMTLRYSTTYKWLTADGRFPLPISPSPPCEFVAGCCVSRTKLSLELFNPREHGFRCNALHPWSATWSEGMCVNCVSVCRTSHNTGRQELWEQLPAIFGLPEWSELT